MGRYLGFTKYSEDSVATVTGEDLSRFDFAEVLIMDNRDHRSRSNGLVFVLKGLVVARDGMCNRRKK